MKKHNAAFLAALMCVAQTALGQSLVTSRTPVAARDIARGSVLSPGDIAWTDTTLTDGSVPAAASVAPGWVAHRLIRAGEILQEPGVAMPDLVRPGDAVDVLYSNAGVAIKVRGTAIGRGVKGDEVYVRLDNRRRLRGIIAGPNTVRVM
ncbi:MAG: flagellar basal body P-ring formation chaperone FlgA [Gemmatimonadota bacterium]|nr:flagellar basal body P-ring formation chaperone FlgA [Gemmatimonadota bacterium]